MSTIARRRPSASVNLFPSAEQETVENVARFVGRDRVGSLRNPSRKSFWANRDDLRAVNFGNKFFLATRNLESFGCRIDAAFFVDPMETSPKGNSRMIVKSRRAGNVVAPSFRHSLRKRRAHRRRGRSW
jgi:hypothetical protein